MKYIQNFKDDDGNDLDPFEEILKYFLYRAQEKNAISFDPDFFVEVIKNKKDIENFMVMLLSIISKGDVEIYETVDDDYKNHDIKEATGEHLDNIGGILNIQRTAATYAEVGLRFTTDTPLKEQQVINEGILVLTEDGIEYETVEELIFKKGEDTAECPAKAKKAGMSERVKADTLTILGTDITGLIKTTCHVTNPSPSTGGSQQPNDDDYRKYLSNYDILYMRSSNYLYKYHLDRYDGINSYNIIPCWDGTGTAKIIVDVNEGSFNQVKRDIAELIDEKIQFIDDKITIEQAEIKTINLYVNVEMNSDNLSTINENTILAECKDVITAYINGGMIDDTEINGLGIGDDLVLYRLGVFLNENVDGIYDVSFIRPRSNVSCDDYSVIRVNEIRVSAVKGDSSV